MVGNSVFKKSAVCFSLLSLLCLETFARHKVDELVQTFLTNSGATAASVAVFSKDAWVIQENYGEAKVGSRFDMASLTKPLATTLATLWIIDQGYGTLDEPVFKTIPNLTACQWAFDRFPEHAKKLKWKKPPAVDEKICVKKNTITVEQLLKHRTGFYDKVPLQAVTIAAPEMKVDPLDVFIESPILLNPGEKFRYADINFIILQKWVEAKLNQRNKTFPGLMREFLFPALGLCETDFFSETPSSLNIPFIRTFRDAKPGQVHDPFSAALGQKGAGHAGLYSSIEDLKKLTLFWMNQGAQQSVISQKIIEQATKDSDDHPPGTKRGLGWDIDSTEYSLNVKGPIIGGFGHTGYTGTSLWIEPKSKLIVIILANRTYVTSGIKSLNAMNELRKQIATLGWSFSQSN